MSADPLLASTVPTSSWEEMHAREHFVQFYENDAALLQAVSGYALKGLTQGSAAIIVATQRHLEYLERQWADMGVDVETARVQGRYVPLEARETLERLLLNGWPQAKRFADVIEPVVRKAAKHFQRVVAFGEMVALLWQERQYGAALHLEGLWNELAERHDFALFCAYPLTRDNHGPIEALNHVCAVHERAIPTESYTGLSDATQRLAAICKLQNRAHRLEQALVDRRNLERQLARRELELSDFLENGAHPLHRVGPDGTIIWANRAELDLLGYGASEYIGHHVREFHVDAQAIDEMLTRLLAGETLRDERARLRCKNGDIKTVIINANALWEDGKFVHSRCFTRDVTVETQAQEALRESERKMREADQRKDEFLALLAHELRNPLAPIRYALSAARKSGCTAEQTRRTEEIIDRQISHMGRLLDDLLDVSRITRGTLELKRARTELRAVLGAAIEAARPILDTKRHTLSLRLPKEPVQLDADPVRLAQVFSNLLINSGKYTDPGGRIELSAVPDKGDIIVTVRDNGIGISAEMMPRLFTMFSQAAGALARAEGGLGIGLALARGLVALHGGTITANSEGSNRGSEFVVRLPTNTSSTQRDEVRSEKGPTSGGSLRILVADDNRDSAITCGAFLELCGHQVQVSYSGSGALRVAEEFHPEVMLLDIGMPEMDGYEVARRVRASSWGGHTTLIAITGWGQDRDRKRAVAAGFDHHLTKPVDPGMLEPLLQRLTSSRTTDHRHLPDREECNRDRSTSHR